MSIRPDDWWRRPTAGVLREIEGPPPATSAKDALYYRSMILAAVEFGYLQRERGYSLESAKAEALRAAGGAVLRNVTIRSDADLERHFGKENVARYKGLGDGKE